MTTRCLVRRRAPPGGAICQGLVDGLSAWLPAAPQRPGASSCGSLRPPSRSRSSLAEWALSQWSLLGVEGGGWEELGVLVVGVEAGLPGGGVQDGVVRAAEKDEVVQR